MIWITDNEIAVKTFIDAQKLAQILLENGYVVMISTEEQLYIINYVWSPSGANRNDVVFQNREVIEEEIFKNDNN